MFENRCPVCNNELIDTAYGRLCFGPDCDVFDEYMPFEEKQRCPRQGNKSILLPSKQTTLSPLMKSTNKYAEG